MAWTAIGYDGSVSESQEAIRTPHMGAGTPVVVGTTDFKVSVQPAFDRTVSIAPGQAWGHGVFAQQDTAQSVQFPILGSGTRWDAVVLRRDWTDNSLTLLGITNPTLNSKTVPTSQMSNNPGVQHDQLLALVQITAGQSAPTALLDLRCWAGKVISTADLMGIPFPVLGTEAVIAGRRYRRTLDSNGNAVWQRPLPQQLLGTAALTAKSGWNAGSPLVQRCLIDETGTDVEYNIELRRTGADMRFASDGNMPDNISAVATLNGPLPDHMVTGRAQCIGSADPNTGLTMGCDYQVDTKGVVIITAGTPNDYIIQMTNTAVASFRATVRFRKAVVS